MPIIVTARETAKEIAGCAKKAVVIRGRHAPPMACLAGGVAVSPDW